MPDSSAHLIRETVKMDSQSSAFDPELRADLCAALNSITEYKGAHPPSETGNGQ
jgi:hypothetical protein